MSVVPDSTKLSKMSLPGTHDSMSYPSNDNSPRNPIWSLHQQLLTGIRFIDINIKQEENDPTNFKLYSGYNGRNLDVTLHDLLGELKTFLTAFKSETVVLNWKEYKPGGIHNFNDLDNLFKEFSDSLIYAGKHSNAIYSTPSLGEVRGKVVLINYKKSSSTGSKAFNHGFDTRGGTKTDENNNNAAQITTEDEICLVGKYLSPLIINVKRAGAIMTRDQYYMTWLNFRYLTTPLQQRCRNVVNSKFQKLLLKEFRTRHLYGTGIVIMDVASPELIGVVVSFNLQGI